MLAQIMDVTYGNYLSEKNKLYDKIVKVSGPHTKVQGNTCRVRDGKDLYGTYHHPLFHYPNNALRNTLVRFEEFECSKDLTDIAVFDFGSNLGSLSIECLNRNAKFVTGFEYVKDRVLLSKEIADFIGSGDRCSFITTDLNKILSSEQNMKTFINKNGQADIVFCSALDAYIENKQSLCRLVSGCSRELCYFETNLKTSVAEFTKIMKSLGFASVKHLGTSKSDAGFGRHSYILDKRKNLSIQKLKKNPRPSSIYNSTHYKANTYYVRILESQKLWEKVQRLYGKIKHIKYVARHAFRKGDLGIIVPEYKKTLIQALKDKDISKEQVKQQIIKLVVGMNQVGVAHRDMHMKNFAYQDGQIYLLDLEFIEEDSRPLRDCYDLTGKGLDSPLRTGNMNLFHNGKLAVHRHINISMKDFPIQKQK